MPDDYQNVLRPEWMIYAVVAVLVLFVVSRVLFILWTAHVPPASARFQNCPTSETYPKRSPCYWLNQLPNRRGAP